ncbi:MAG: hypothetical protein ABIU20_02040 [Blastocatellia bacterium]
MKSSKMTLTLVATLIIILTAFVGASAQGRLAAPSTPTIIAPPNIQELAPYVGQYHNLPIANDRNPYEWVGQYHNAALDYIGKAASSPASAARIIGPFPGGSPGPTIPCWPDGDIIWRINMALFKPYAPQDVSEAIDQRRSLFIVDKSAPNARHQVSYEWDKVRFTDRDNTDFSEFNFQLTGLTMALGSGRLAYNEYQHRVVELENTVLGSRTVSETVKTQILLTTTVARHSAWYHVEGPAAAKHKCPTCVSSDVAGAGAGAAVGGIWGAVIGAVAMSALDYFTQSN